MAGLSYEGFEVGQVFGHEALNQDRVVVASCRRTGLTRKGHA